MRSLLTRKLMVLVLHSTLFSSASALAATNDGLQAEEQAAYLSELKRLYLTSDERQALLAHSNALLDTYALRAAYQVGQAQRDDLTYRLSTGASGELILREEVRGSQGTAVSVRNRHLSVFGLDPYIRYECPPSGIRCTLLNPRDGQPLLTIVRDLGGAAELAKALSFLIRNVQKG